MTKNWFETPVCLYIVFCFILICCFDQHAIATNLKDESKYKSQIENWSNIKQKLIETEKDKKTGSKSAPQQKRNQDTDLDEKDKRYIVNFTNYKLNQISASVINDRLNSIGRKNLILQRIDNKRESLASYKGKSLIINIWATWCVPCVQELKSLKKIHRELKSRNFEILAVSHDESKEQIKAFLKGKRIEFPVYFDPNRRVYRKLVDDTEIPVLPFSILIDATGKVFKAYVGEQEWDSQDALAEIEIILPQK